MEAEFFPFCHNRSILRILNCLFGTPLDLEFEHAVKMFKGEFTKIEDWDHLESEMMKATESNGIKSI